MVMVGTGLGDLPPEVLGMVIGILGFKDAVECSLACKFLRELALPYTMSSIAIRWEDLKGGRIDTVGHLTQYTHSLSIIEASRRDQYEHARLLEQFLNEHPRVSSLHVTTIGSTSWLKELGTCPHVTSFQATTTTTTNVPRHRQRTRFYSDDLRCFPNLARLALSKCDIVWKYIEHDSSESPRPTVLVSDGPYISSLAVSDCMWEYPFTPRDLPLKELRVEISHETLPFTFSERLSDLLQWPPPGLERLTVQVDAGDRNIRWILMDVHNCPNLKHLSVMGLGLPTRAFIDEKLPRELDQFELHVSISSDKMADVTRFLEHCGDRIKPLVHIHGPSTDLD